MSARRVLAILIAAAATCFGQLWKDDSAPIQLTTSELLQMLEQICPGQGFVAKENSGCHVCPSFSQSAGITIDSSLSPVIAGHFSDPKSQDLVMSLRGCESHANGFQDVMLFTKSPEGWSLESPGQGGGPTGDCRIIRNREGRDGLLCLARDNHFATAETRLYFSYVSGSGEASLVSLVDNRAQGCDYGPNMYVAGELRKVARLPGANGRLTIRVTVSCTRAPKDCSDKPAKPSKRRTGVFELAFQFDGEALQLAPSSQKENRELEACLSFE